MFGMAAAAEEFSLSYRLGTAENWEGDWHDVLWTETEAGGVYEAICVFPANTVFPKDVAIVYDAGGAMVSTVGGQLPSSFSQESPMAIQLGAPDAHFTVTVAGEGSSAQYFLYVYVEEPEEPEEAEETDTVDTAPLEAVTVTPAASGDIRITFNGQYLSFDQPPIIVENRTLVPMRAIFETLGLTVEWDAEEQAVSAVGLGARMYLQIGSDRLYRAYDEMDGVDIINLDVPAQIINDRTYVPLRAVSEGLWADVTWNQAERTVVITREMG
jgi:hypothetical protein